MEMPTWVKVVIGIVIFLLATVLGVYLAGVFILIGMKLKPAQADLLTYYQYWYYYHDVVTFQKKLRVSAIFAALVAYGVPIVAYIAATRNVRELHGSARFANTSEIEKAGLLGSVGIIVGKWKNRFLMFAGMQFVLLMAPTRSGKGTGIVIPNLLAWPESVVALDVKLENFLITSKFRAEHGQEVYLFNPFSISEDAEGNPLNGRTHRYNPLGYISDNPRLRVTDILAIGYSLYPGEGRDAFFDDAARNLFLGLTLYLCETPSLPRTMGELLRQSSGKGRPVKEHIQGLINERNYREHADIEADVPAENAALIKAIADLRGMPPNEGDALLTKIPKAQVESIEAALTAAGIEFETATYWVPLVEWDGVGEPMLSRECVDALMRFTSTSDNTLSSIMATFNVPLTIWASPIVDAATSANDFDLRDVRKRRMSIYLGIPANKLAEAKLLLNMFYTQLVNLNTNQLLHSTPELKYQCLMLDDEFTAPGRIGIIDKANSYMAGYGLRLLTIVQSPGQLEAEPPKGYGKENARTFITNHALQILYTPREQRDANEYSEMLGYTTVHAKNVSHGTGRDSISQSEGEGAGQRRALLLPQELKEMSQKEQVISLENTKAIKCEKITYYNDHVFMDRLKSVSPTLQALGRKLPSKKQLEDVWGSGELASPVPALDLDLHDAVIEVRTRPLTMADVEQGIDLRKLALDTSKLEIPKGDVSPADVENIVNSFFSMIDGAAGDFGEDVADDGTSAAPSADELAALEAAASDDAGLSLEEIAAIQSAEEPADDELINSVELIETDNPIDMDNAAMAAAMDSANEYAFSGIDDMPPDDMPILDLSVLDMPLAQKENQG